MKRTAVSGFALGLVLVVCLDVVSAATTAATSPCTNCSGVAGMNAGDSSLSGKLSAVATADACCALCRNNAACVVWTWAPSTHTCWLKDNARGLHSQDDRVLGLCGAPLPPPSPPGPKPPGPPPSPPSPPPPPSAVNVTVTLNSERAIWQTAVGYVSYTLDWWLPTEGASPEGWGPDASVLELNFDSPKLQMLTAALGPAYLRIGGSLDKEVVYDMPSSVEKCVCHPPPHHVPASTPPGVRAVPALVSLILLPPSLSGHAFLARITSEYRKTCCLHTRRCALIVLPNWVAGSAVFRTRCWLHVAPVLPQRLAVDCHSQVCSCDEQPGRLWPLFPPTGFCRGSSEH